MNKAVNMTAGKYILYLNSNNELVEGILDKIIPILKNIIIVKFKHRLYIWGIDIDSRRIKRGYYNPVIII